MVVVMREEEGWGICAPLARERERHKMEIEENNNTLLPTFGKGRGEKTETAAACHKPAAAQNTPALAT